MFHPSGNPLQPSVRFLSPQQASSATWAAAELFLLALKWESIPKGIPTIDEVC